MPAMIREAIYLGNFADADTNEFSYSVENTSIYQQSFGSSGDPLYDHQFELTFNDSDNNTIVDTNNSAGSESVSYDIGSGPVTVLIDSLAVVDVDVTYTNGSTISYSDVVMFQDDTGNLFLTNSNFAGTDLNITGGVIESFTVTNTPNTNFAGLYVGPLQEFVCFSAGTRILTNRGRRPVETLRPGDEVATLDNGYCPLKWVGRRTVCVTKKTMPIRIKKAALGAGLPSQALIVSPQHRILVDSVIAERMYGNSQVLISAKHLVGMPGVRYVQKWANVQYVHLLFETHEIVFAQDAPTESMFLGPESLNNLSTDQLAEIEGICPEIFEMQPARTFAVGKKRDRLLYRHQKHKVPALDPRPETAQLAKRSSLSPVSFPGV